MTWGEFGEAASGVPSHSRDRHATQTGPESGRRQKASTKAGLENSPDVLGNDGALLVEREVLLELRHV